MATRNRNRGYRDSNQQWNDSGNYANQYQRDYNNDRGGYNSGSTYGNRGYQDWQNDTERGYYGRPHRRYGDQQKNFGSTNYYGSQGSSYGEGSTYGNRRREEDYENSGTSWGDSNSSNYRSSYRGYPDYEDYERGSYGDSGSRYRNYGGDYGSAYGGSRFSNNPYRESSRGQQNYGRYGSSYGGGYYGSQRQDEQQDRGWWDKTTDEVSSWFGDDEAERRREQDRRREGQHRGKGPKGYQRSDERIKDDINDRLSDDAFVDAGNIEVTVVNGEVTLTGTVSDRSEKRRAEDIADDVSGVKNVEVRLRVQDDSNAGYRTSSYGTTTVGTSAASEKTRNRQSSLTETK
jgi:osmotically-inducible protein OsmY